MNEEFESVQNVKKLFQFFVDALTEKVPTSEAIVEITNLAARVGGRLEELEKKYKEDKLRP